MGPSSNNHTRNSRRANAKIKEVHSLRQGAGSGKLKKKIRDVQRTLRKPGLAANKRLEAERALKGLEQELAGVQNAAKARENGQKYHMVRFFERKKAVRRLRRAVKDIIADSPETETGLEEMRKREVDLYYTVMFPMDQKYLALYPSEKEGDIDEVREKNEVWVSIREKVLKGELASGLNSKKTDSKAISEVERIRKQGLSHQNPAKDTSTNDNGDDADANEFNDDQQDEFFE